MALERSFCNPVVRSGRASVALVVIAAASMASGQSSPVPSGPLSPAPLAIQEEDPASRSTRGEPIETQPTDEDATLESEAGERPPLSKEVAPPRQERKPLGSPTSAGQSGSMFAPASGSKASSGAAWWVRTGLALGVVIALILLLRAGMTKLARIGGGLGQELGAGGRAPSGVLEVLGRYPVARGQTLVLLKMDRRIVLLGQTASGFTTLCEVTDPDEVASLLVKTRDEEGLSMAAQFNAMLDEAGRDEGLLDEPISIVERADDENVSQNGHAADPASTLRQRLAGLRGLEA